MLSGQRETCADQRTHADDCVGGAELRKRAARVLTACLQAPRSSLDLDRAFISK